MPVVQENALCPVCLVRIPRDELAEHDCEGRAGAERTGFQLDHRSHWGEVEISHLEGVPWWEAPRPRRWHFCRAQTLGWIDYFTRVERCACGATRLNGRGWFERNSRRKEVRADA